MAARKGFVTLVCPSPWPLGERVSHGSFSAVPLPDPDNLSRHIVEVPAELAHHFCDGPAGFVRLNNDADK
jgi:hypothetical protein